MDTEDRAGSEKLGTQYLRDLDVFGQASSIHKEWRTSRFADVRAERLATLLEALAEEFQHTAEVLRSRGIR